MTYTYFPLQIKGDRLCNRCLSTSTYGSNDSTFKVELLDSDENGLLADSEDTKIEQGTNYGIIKTEPSSSGYEPIGSLPNGALVHIENDIRNSNHKAPIEIVQENVGYSNSTALNLEVEQPIQVKQEQIDDDCDMQIESQYHYDDQTANLDIKEEITFEEPCLTEVQLGPVERKPPVSCPQCDKCFPNRAALHQHVRRIHHAKPLDCDICGLELPNTDRLNYHKVSILIELKVQETFNHHPIIV